MNVQLTIDDAIKAIEEAREAFTGVCDWETGREGEEQEAYLAQLEDAADAADTAASEAQDIIAEGGNLDRAIELLETAAREEAQFGEATAFGPVVELVRGFLGAAQDLQHLMAQLKFGKHADGWDALETFADNAPEDTCEVWSWDEDSMLVGDCADNLKIVPR